jgi:hypothetical protein
MGTHSPLQIALFIVAGLAAVGVTIAYLRTRMTYSGYEDIFHDIRKLGSSMKGEIFRDGADVVISGTWEKNPVVVRFSNQENTPGLNIRMPAAAQFQISVTGAGVQVTEGPRTPVKTADDMFDARFTTRTDQAMQARMLLTKPVTAVLQKLACSKNTYLALGSGCIEHSELTIPDPAAQHVLDHLKSLAALAAALRNMPGAEKVKILKIEHERHVFTRMTMAAGVVVAIASVVAAVQVPTPIPTGANETLSNGILPTDAVVIADAPAWHAAGAQEMEVAGVEMLRTNGIPASGRIVGDFSGTATGQDVAYLLINDEGKKRVVIIGGHQKRYDVRFNNIAMIARVPKDALSSTPWKNDKAPTGIAGDGLLIVREPEVAESGVVVFLTADGITSFTPTSWHDVRLK